VPGLLALAKAIVDRQELLLAARVGADQHQDALALVLEARREIDPVGPDVDVAPGGEIAPLPAPMILLPRAHQATDRGRRQARRVRAQQRRERVPELPGGDALQVQPGQQLLDVPGAPQIGRQDGRGEADARGITGATIVHTRPPDLDRSDPRLDLTPRCVAVAHQAPASLVVDQIVMGGEKARHLGLDRVAQHPPCPLAQHAQQRIVLDRPTWPRQRNDGILIHGVSSHR
jgi:hypothetical protein